MKNSDLLRSLKDMSYDEALAKIRAIREGRVKPIPTNKTRVARRQRKKEDSIKEMLDQLSPEEREQLLKDLEG